MTKTKTDQDVMQIALEIKRHLAEYPGAADCLEGVLDWWLAGQMHSEDKVRLALEWLVEQGHAEKIVLGGRAIYANKNNFDKFH